MAQTSQIDRGNLDKVAVDNAFVIPQPNQDRWTQWTGKPVAGLSVASAAMHWQWGLRPSVKINSGEYQLWGAFDAV